MHSAAGLAAGRLIRERPFRAPHHTISAQGLVGGGSVPRPGEITLAHRGVLFLDELAEFARVALDALRQPLEEGRVEIMRGQRTLEFPANAILVAACNRCPCGRSADRCRCAAGERDRYLRRLSGPLLDRFDLVCEVHPVPPVELVADDVRGPSSAATRERVAGARERQRRRLRGSGALCNGDMDGRLTRRSVRLDADSAAGLVGARERTGLSGRGHDRVLRVARTIADLADRERRRLGRRRGGALVSLRRLGAAGGVSACDVCLRRSRLVALLAPRITGLLGRGGRAQGLLGLRDEDLIEAAGGRGKELVRERLARFDASAERARARRGGGVRGLPARTPIPAGSCSSFRTHPRPSSASAVRSCSRPAGARPRWRSSGPGGPSPYGTEVAYALGRGLGAAGVPVVSGLALGIDATSHRGCLDGGGAPLAVLACGPERAYPRRHRRLHEQVAERGLVVSELPPGTAAQRWSFPARNRIMAGLARMTLVVEAADPSGSLITAEFARDLGRAVAAVPGRVTARMAEGTNGLLRDGAVPVTSIEDVLDELYGVGMRPPPALELRRGPPADPGLRAVLDAVEAGLGRRRDRRPHRGHGVRGPRGTRSTRGRRTRGPRRPRRLGASRHVSARRHQGNARTAHMLGAMVPDAKTPPRLLSIAGSDSGGGAGIQADLKAFAACGAHGMTAITAITAQNTERVSAVYPLPPEAIVEQVRAVVEDIGVDAVKIGMVGNAAAIEAVVEALGLLPADVPVVLDPVMVAESGGRLLEPDAERSLRERLVPRATVVTPNLMEAAALAGLGADDRRRASSRGRCTRWGRGWSW